MTSEEKQIFTRRITTANSTEMVVILYEMALCYLQDAECAYEERNREEFRLAIRRTRGCINELMNSLHMEYEPAPALLQLYLYCVRKLALSDVKYEKSGLAEIKKVLEPLKDAYKSLSELNESGPVMGNSQTVYAGLTYGRDTLNEELVGASNRGFFA